MKEIPRLVVVSRSASLRAAQQIVSDLTDPTNGTLLPPGQSQGLQHIHLIGHSRGAAVNAMVAGLLQQKGYVIDQYTALDGYAIDWPGAGGKLGDADIVSLVKATRKVNYRVQEGIEGFVLGELLKSRGAIARAIGLLGPPLRNCWRERENPQRD